VGLAAAQARFLHLTGRKTNVEYEGQQVNQARTTLANQSANYYNQLLMMKVPTPPSTADFTKVVYTFEDGSLSNEITFLVAKPNGEYMVSYNSSYNDDFAIIPAHSNLITEGEQVLVEDSALYLQFTQGTAGGCYTYVLNHTGNQKGHIEHVLEHLIPLGTHTTSDGKNVNVTSSDHWWTVADGQYGGDKVIMQNIRNEIAGTAVQQKFIDLLYKCKTTPNNTTTSDALKEELVQLVEKDLRFTLAEGYKIGVNELREMGKIAHSTVGANGELIYEGNDKYLKTLSSDQLTGLIEEENNYVKMLNEKFGYEDDEKWVVKYTENTTTGTWTPYFYNAAEVENAFYNDYTQLQESNVNSYTIGSDKVVNEIKGVPARFEQDASGRYTSIVLHPGDPVREKFYALKTDTTTDQVAYENAMDQYYYNKNEYDQAMQQINAKIKVVQEKDRSLELKLRQFDTEQDAITQELEAVKKVLEKNTENSFNIFG